LRVGRASWPRLEDCGVRPAIFQRASRNDSYRSVHGRGQSPPRGGLAVGPDVGFERTNRVGDRGKENRNNDAAAESVGRGASGCRLSGSVEADRERVGRQIAGARPPASTVRAQRLTAFTWPGIGPAVAPSTARMSVARVKISSRPSLSFSHIALIAARPVTAPRKAIADRSRLR
jgi:hypothetical protein